MPDAEVDRCPAGPVSARQTALWIANTITLYHARRDAQRNGKGKHHRKHGSPHNLLLSLTPITNRCHIDCQSYITIAAFTPARQRAGQGEPRSGRINPAGKVSAHHVVFVSTHIAFGKADPGTALVLLRVNVSARLDHQHRYHPGRHAVVPLAADRRLQPQRRPACRARGAHP